MDRPTTHEYLLLHRSVIGFRSLWKILNYGQGLSPRGEEMLINGSLLSEFYTTTMARYGNKSKEEKFTTPIQIATPKFFNALMCQSMLGHLESIHLHGTVMYACDSTPFTAI
jgi:hypothetical protein